MNASPFKIIKANKKNCHMPLDKIQKEQANQRCSLYIIKTAQPAGLCYLRLVRV